MLPSVVFVTTTHESHANGLCSALSSDTQLRNAFKLTEKLWFESDYKVLVLVWINKC